MWKIEMAMWIRYQNATWTTAKGERYLILLRIDNPNASSSRKKIKKNYQDSDGCDRSLPPLLLAFSRPLESSPRVDKQTRLKTRHPSPPWYFYWIINRKHLRDSDDRLVKSTSPLKPPRGTKHGDRLVHDPFADAKIFVNPLLDFSVFGYTVRVQARSVKDPAVVAERRTSQFVSLILVLYHCRSKRDVRGDISWGWTSMYAAYRASKHLRITEGDECKRERGRQ